MQLISTGRKTILSDFADLETVSEYVHCNGESTDFQFSAQRRAFVEVNRGFGLAVMRIKEKHHKPPEIQRVRKLTIDNVFCVGCAKQGIEEIAVGQTNGCVKLYNYRTAQLIHRFSTDQQHNSVLYVDYNSTDEYIAAARENGEVNIFGIKTRTKMDTINFDDHVTLARFHPSKRFQLSLASYKGAVFVYDIQAKRKIFSHVAAHNAPCRDVSMCNGQPALLVSVGYDCRINIFDLRRKVQSTSGQLSFNHPLSAVTLSECGTYFCAGNLKGELLTYDMRTTKTPLAQRALHDVAVMRVGFVPNSHEDLEQPTLASNTSHNVTVEETPVPQTQPRHQATSGYGSAPSMLVTPATTSRIPGRDSFCDFLDAQGPRAVDRMSTRLTLRRDSFDWETLNRKPSSEDRLSSIESVDTTASISETSKLQQTLSGPLRDRSNLSGDSKLKQIAETDETTAGIQEQIDDCSAASSNCTGSDKENPPVMINVDLKRRLKLLPASRYSTPNHDANSKPQHHQQQQQQQEPNSPPISDENVRREFENLREFMEQRMENLEKEMKFVAEQNKWEIFTQVANFWNQQLDNTQEIRDALALLLQNDRFTFEFARLKMENTMLKAQLQEFLNESEQ